MLVPGALCFLLGPIGPIARALGPRTDVWVFFVGSLFFTASGTLQLTGALREQERTPWRPDLWSAGIQLFGMVLFNVSTIAATFTGLDTIQERQIVWKPDLFGSIAFLLAAMIASWAAGAIHWPPHSRNRWTATVNLFGCIAFMVSAGAAYVLSDGDLLREQTANRFTSIGALGFLICAVRAMADADVAVGITPSRLAREERRERWLEEHLTADEERHPEERVALELDEQVTEHLESVEDQTHDGHRHLRGSPPPAG